MNLPTKLTILRIVLIPIFVALYFIKFSFNGVFAVAVFMIACFTDFLDGHLARKWNQVTTLGKFLDPIADKLLVMCAMVCVVKNGTVGATFTLVLAIYLMIIESRELTISCFRTIAAAKGTIMQADKWGKSKTFTQMIALIILIPHKCFVEYGMAEQFTWIWFYVGFGLLSVAVVLAIISACNYMLKNKAVFKDDRN